MVTVTDLRTGRTYVTHDSEEARGRAKADAVLSFWLRRRIASDMARVHRLAFLARAWAARRADA